MGKLDYNRKTNRHISNKGNRYGTIKPTILRYNDNMPFGKYVGVKISKLLTMDKAYLKWLYLNNDGKIEFESKLIELLK